MVPLANQFLYIPKPLDDAKYFGVPLYIFNSTSACKSKLFLEKVLTVETIVSISLFALTTFLISVLLYIFKLNALGTTE